MAGGTVISPLTKSCRISQPQLVPANRTGPVLKIGLLDGCSVTVFYRSCGHAYRERTYFTFAGAITFRSKINNFQ